MTDLPLSPNTHLVPSLDSIAPAATGTPPLSNGQPNGFAEDEEDYTIKCICGYQEDDGSTILCETCQTWQHIECYYRSQGIRTPGEDENHYCHECEPRALDSKSAAQRQRERRGTTDQADAKVKKSAPTKGSRKKKALDHATNGLVGEKFEGPLRNGTNGSPREHVSSSKRSKGGHRASNSVQTVPLKLPAQTSRRSTSASHTLQSPSKSSQKHSRVESEPYSIEFMQLYDNDTDDTSMKRNLMNDIDTANLLSLWSHDADAIREATEGKTHQDVFFRSAQSFDDIDKPMVNKHTKIDESREYHGRQPKWTYLTIESEAPESLIIGEITGKIGQKNEYTQDEASRWDYLRHPAPFVFFHPFLPIYIDARQESTIFRYVRRSCKPSLKMKTLLENGSEMRFLFCANKDISPGEELTLAWTPDNYIRDFVRWTQEPEKFPQPLNVDVGYVREYFSRVLPNFGGCACEDPKTCNIRNACQPGDDMIDELSVNGKNKKLKKGVASHSRSNGRTPSSRSGSEALRYNEDDEEDDGDSTSASSRSKPHSRDASPPDQKTDREKRKFAALIDQIKSTEEEQKKPKRQKNKRTSGGIVKNTTAPASASRLTFADQSESQAMASDGLSSSVPNTPALANTTRYVDAGTTRQGSDSPRLHSPIMQSGVHKVSSTIHAPSNPSPLARPNYIDTATQVDMDKDTGTPSSPSVQRRPVVSLTKRLLKRCHREKIELDRKREESVRSSTASQSPTVSEKAEFVSPTSAPNAVPKKDDDGDVMMESDNKTGSESPIIKYDPVDVPPAAPAETVVNGDIAMHSPKPKVESPEMPAPGIPSPSEAKSRDEPVIINGFRPAGLHVQLPSPPPFNTVTNSNNTVPTVSQSPIIQTPTSMSNIPSFTPTSTTALVQPSPAKKKLSLGDYMSRRSSNINKADPANHAPTAPMASDKDESPTAATPVETLLKPLEALKEEAREHDADAASAIVETPKADETGDPMVIDTSMAD